MCEVFTCLSIENSTESTQHTLMTLYVICDLQMAEILLINSDHDLKPESSAKQPVQQAPYHYNIHASLHLVKIEIS